MKEREKRQLQLEQQGRLRELIKELGVTQKEFCDKVDVSEVFLSRIMTGKTMLSEKLANKIGREYGLNSQWLVYGEGKKYNDSTESDLKRSNQLQKIAAMRETIKQLAAQLDELENEVNQ